MARFITRLVCAAVFLSLTTPAGASVFTCRNAVAKKGAALYDGTAKAFESCGRSVAAGKPCDAAKRDAKLAAKLSATRAAVLAGCDDGTAHGLGFTTNDAVAIRVGGFAEGEGRTVADSVYGRTPGALTPVRAVCAKALVDAASKAGKTMITTLVPCGGFCSAVQSKVDAAFTKASTTIGLRCSPGDVTALTGGDTTAFLTKVRAGGQRVVDSLHPGSLPAVSMAVPGPSQVIVPPGMPTNIDIAAVVNNVPSPSYVSSVEIGGHPTTYDGALNRFEHSLFISTSKSAVPVFIRARTTFGTFSTTGTLHLNLAALAPGVVIDSPTTGAITGASSVTVSGHVIGNLAKADVLQVGGVVTTFDPGTGAFSRSVPIGPNAVNVIRAQVQSISLGTTEKDSVVVMKGTSWPLNLRVPSGNFNRLNNSGLNDVKPIVQAQLDSAFDPSVFIGQEIDGGTITAFSTGSKTASLAAIAAHSVSTSLSVNNFHLHVDGLSLGCNLTYDAQNITVTAVVDLVGQLQVSLNDIQVIFTNDNASVGGGILCSIGSLFTDARAKVHDALIDQFTTKLPDAFNDALAGIDVGGPIGDQLDMTIDAQYADIPEDSQGVTFIVDSNITATNPAPDAPPITATLLPSSPGSPILGPTIPSTATPYDLGFCLSDGFVNRAMAAFMQKGLFNQSLGALPVGGNTVPLTTTILSFLFTDNSYSTTCANCPVTLVLKPTAAAVARAPQGGETGSVVLTVPNYRLDLVADQSGTPVPLLSANVTFDLPLTLGVAGSTITPTVGAISIGDVSVVDNPIGANESAFATQVATLFPLAAQSLGALFGQIPLPHDFQGLQISGVGAGYNVSCTALYLNLTQ